MSASKEGIRTGFLRNGMLYEKGRCIPDLYSMIATCRRKVTVAEMNLIEDTFPHQFKIQIENGFVTDKIFRKYGFPIDIDSFGNEVHRNALISKDHYQYAMCNMSKSHNSKGT